MDNNIPLTMTFAYLEVSMLLTALERNFDIKPKANCQEKSIQEYADKKLLKNRKLGKELFKS